MARPQDGRVYYERVPGKSQPSVVAERVPEPYRRGDTGEPIAQKNDGLSSRGWEFWHETDCPCTICGHTTQEECEAAGCDCCSSFCT